MLKQISMFGIAILIGWPLISRIDQKPVQPQFVYHQKRYTSKPVSRPDRPSLPCMVALHCVKLRLKIRYSHGDTCELKYYERRLDLVTT